MPGNPLTDPNWASDTTNKIVTVVGTVREQTTTKAVMAARAVVFGIIAAFLGVFILVISIVLLMRGIQLLLDLVVDPRAGGVPQLLHRRWNALPGRVVAVQQAQRQRSLTRRPPLNDSSRENHQCPTSLLRFGLMFVMSSSSDQAQPA